MDWISELPEALLLRILSLLQANDVVATMVLSKRWQFLWMMVPRLLYDDSYQNPDHERFSRFVNRSLLLHEAPVVEYLHFKLGQKSCDEDIGVWTRTLSKRCVLELVIEIDNSSSTSPAILPRSLYTGCCRMLVTLKLNNVVLVDFNSSSVSFPSLKTLSLVRVEYPGDEFVKKFLSSCHVLEDLDVEQCPYDNVTIFTVIVASLKSLVLYTLQNIVEYEDVDGDEDDDDYDDEYGVVIDAPCLEYLKIVDHTNGFCIIEKNMPNIVEANFDIRYTTLGSITLVERLHLCLSNSKDVYPVSTVFHCLVHLTLCTCETEWLNLLMCFLRDSPNLQSLKLEQFHDISDEDSRPCWKEPSSVPECVLTSLETLEWVKYEGREEEKQVVTFILRNANYLKKVTISPEYNHTNATKLEMITDLALSSRCSPTCQLIFDY